MPKSEALKIAIVGRPNVGKSSLFNRIVGSRRAIVESASGTTRDRLYADIKWKGKGFTVIDTGGFESPKQNDITALIVRQLERAIEEADIIFFVTDGKAGVVHQDSELASRLRKTSKKIYTIVNKVDDRSQSAKALDFFELGLGEPYPVSAVNGIGIERLLDDAVKDAAKALAPDGRRAVNVAIVGRPNVGKSSYLNAILNEDRAIVHPVAGTTRDSLDTDFEYKGDAYRFIDTAGMRHNTKLESAADFYGGVRSKEAIKRSDVAMVLLDGLDGLREDDERVINFCVEEGKPVIVVVNKSDLIKSSAAPQYKEMLIKKMSAIKDLPVVFVSCKTKKNIIQSLDMIRPLCDRAKVAFNAQDIAGILGRLNDSQEIRNRRLKFEYLVQNGVNPPGFTLGMKNPKYANENLRRYIENFLKKTCDFEGVPVSVRFEKRLKK